MTKCDQLRFTVAVIHRNGAERLDGALFSIENAIDPSRDEIIVVDNASSDGSLEAVLARHPVVRVIRNNCNAGYARACNQAMRAGRGEFFLLCNNDLKLPQDALNLFESDFCDFPKAGLIGGKLSGADGYPQRSCGGSPGFLSELGLLRTKPQPLDRGRVERVEGLVGACMAARGTAVDAAGGLDDSFFFYFEEGEWCLRMRRRGWDVLFDPRVRIMHVGGGSTSRWQRASRVEFFRSRLLYYRRTMNPLQITILYFWRGLHLLWGVFSYSLLVTLTFGFSQRLRTKLDERLLLVAWIARGCPIDWGLPDKCQPGFTKIEK